jgi:mono/diheme cytochrome c family protein
MKPLGLAVCVAIFLVAATPKKKMASVHFDPKLPVLGTQLAPLPAGSGLAIAQTQCLQCHSSDILRQQRLTEKQWTAAVEKMIKWGAVVKDDEKPLLIAYLAKHFGPANTAFKPVKTRPVGK